MAVVPGEQRRGVEVCGYGGSASFDGAASELPAGSQCAARRSRWRSGAASMRALAGEVARIAAPGAGQARLRRGPAHRRLGERRRRRTGRQDLARSPELRAGRAPRRHAAGCASPPASAPEIQHRAPQLLERINGFFGYGAVARLALVQGPPLRPPAPAGAGRRGRSPPASGRRLTGVSPASTIPACATRCAARRGGHRVDRALNAAVRAAALQ